MVKRIIGKAEYTGRAYLCEVEGLSKRVSVAKFDTGADHTMITPNILANDPLSPEDMDVLKKHLLETKRDVLVELESASGHTTNCFLSCLHNVSIFGTTLETFYFFLAVQDNAKFLIGNDLIRKLTFRHEIDSDIVISEFDYSGYTNYFENYIQRLKAKNGGDVKAVEIDEIMGVLSHETDEVIEAAIQIRGLREQMEAEYSSEYSAILPKEKEDMYLIEELDKSVKKVTKLKQQEQNIQQMVRDKYGAYMSYVLNAMVDGNDSCLIPCDEMPSSGISELENMGIKVAQNAFPGYYNIDLTHVQLFDAQRYLKDYLNLLPPASVANCKTKKDCDDLLDRLNLLKGV